MTTLKEQKTIQTRILEYAEANNWTLIPLKGTKRCRGLDLKISLKELTKKSSTFVQRSTRCDGGQVQVWWDADIWRDI